MYYAFGEKNSCSARTLLPLLTQCDLRRVPSTQRAALLLLLLHLRRTPSVDHVTSLLRGGQLPGFNPLRASCGNDVALHIGAQMILHFFVNALKQISRDAKDS